MFLKDVLRYRHNIALRLTGWYALLFFCSMLAVYFICEVVMLQSLNNRMQTELLDEAAEYVAVCEGQGMNILAKLIVHEANAEGTGKIFSRIFDASGALIASSDMRAWGDIPLNRTAFDAALRGVQFFETIDKGMPDDSHSMPARSIYTRLDQNHVLQFGMSMWDDSRLATSFRSIFGAVAGTVLLCSVLAGAFIPRRGLAGLEEVRRTAARIAAGDLNSRVPESGHGNEVDRLATTFNHMLERIQTLIADLKEVSDDVAHDLRSPLTRLRGTAEMAISSDLTNEDLRSALGSVVEECDSLLKMINTMLDISATEAGVATFNRQELDAAQLVSDACDLFLIAAEDKGVRLEALVEPPVWVRCDHNALNRVMGHLLDNAVKYTSSGGQITVTAHRHGDRAVIQVQDTGIGIPREELEHVFKRFYRSDRSRSQSGNGMGLSLSAALVTAHKGTIRVQSEEGKGSTFTVTLPASGYLV